MREIQELMEKARRFLSTAEKALEICPNRIGIPE